MINLKKLNVEILAGIIAVLLFLLILNTTLIIKVTQSVYITKSDYCEMIRVSLKPKYLPKNQISLCYEELRPKAPKVK